MRASEIADQIACCLWDGHPTPAATWGRRLYDAAPEPYRLEALTLSEALSTGDVPALWPCRLAESLATSPQPSMALLRERWRWELRLLSQYAREALIRTRLRELERVQGHRRQALQRPLVDRATPAAPAASRAGFCVPTVLEFASAT